MKIDGWSNLLVVVASAWVLSCGSVRADVPELEEAVAVPASAHSTATSTGETGERPESPAGNVAADSPADEAADQRAQAERARGEQVVKTVGKVVLFILLIPLALLVGGGSISFK